MDKEAPSNSVETIRKEVGEEDSTNVLVELRNQGNSREKVSQEEGDKNEIMVHNTTETEENWDIEDAEPLSVQLRLFIKEKEKETSLDKRRLVKSILASWNADIICIQETKLEGNMTEIVKQLWGGRWVDFTCLEASGTRGGKLMLWDSRVWKGEILEIKSYTLTCKFEAQLRNFFCHVTGVYAPNCYIERRLVWEEIGSVRGLIEGPWALCGDFNVCRYISEKRICTRRTKGMKEFSDFIEDMNLIDLLLEDAKYTWFKWDLHEAASRIDRMLISADWDDSFNNMNQIPLQKITSDHTPIALQGGSWQKKKSYFKFENWWLGTEGFIDIIKGWWNSFSYEGRPDSFWPVR
ncbi:hypothetical protein MTR67_048940 [Solanum verrucosum]|uniref:Endonuclease/exonuclease/phosphatase domain-containing protein n=1 Tax=Solanum verrucosum TaxID=315347 RepID=A0AAF0UZC6_SOLVR|nr:hypothetical protein MTR67_048940 [Solanum verrucosum]